MSSFATLIALASHLAGGGAMPPVVLVMTVGVLSWLPAVLLVGRRLSPLRQTLVIGLAESTLHLLFTAAATAPGRISPVAMERMGSMPGMPPRPVSTLSAMPMPAPGMWLAHVVAALLTILAWNRGEAAFWALARLAGRLRRAVVPGLPCGDRTVRLPRLLLRIETVPSFHLARVLRVRARRGPPATVPQY